MPLSGFFCCSLAVALKECVETGKGLFFLFFSFFYFLFLFNNYFFHLETHFFLFIAVVANAVCYYNLYLLEYLKWVAPEITWGHRTLQLSLQTSAAYQLQVLCEQE